MKRNLVILGGSSVLAIGVGCALFFFGPASLQLGMTNALATQQLAAQAVQFTILEKGDRAASVQERTNYRITSEADLQALWPLIYGTNTPLQLPRVDFSTYDVLGIFDGTHPTKGYAISVTDIEDTADARVITIDHSQGNATCPPTQGVSSAYEILEVPKTTLPLHHQDMTEVMNCPQS